MRVETVRRTAGERQPKTPTSSSSRARCVTDVGGTIGASVLSTPGMIAMMERCSSVLAYEHLPDGQGDGRLRGLRQARRGGRSRASTCAVRSTLREVVDDRKLRFDVEVTEGDRTIGVGTHERRVIDTGQLG